MHTATILSAVLSVLALAEAAPTPDARSGPYSVPIKHDGRAAAPALERRAGPYSIPMKHNLNIVRTKEHKAIAAANTANVRARYSEHAERAEEADARLTSWRRDFMYTIDVDIGTPAQTLSMHVDTGSSSTYALTKNCSVSACKTNNIPLFDYDKSSTFQLWNTTARKSLTYGSGFAAGLWSNDTMGIGPFKVENQAFMGAYNTDRGYVGSTTSGLMGLGFQSIAVAGETPWWMNAMQDWDDKRFGIYLERANLNDIPPEDYGNATTGFKATSGGTLTLGGVDEDLFEGEIHYNTVTEARYWMIEMEGIKLNGKALTHSGGKRTITDTGSTLSYFPAEFAKQIFDSIPGSIEAEGWGPGMYAIPCKSDIKFAFTIGGVDYDIFPDDMLWTVYNETEGTCVAGIVGESPGGLAEFLLGAAFLKNVYSVHRAEPPALGFAKLKNQGTPYAHWPEYKGNATTSGGNTTVPETNPPDNTTAPGNTTLPDNTTNPDNTTAPGNTTSPLPNTTVPETNTTLPNTNGTLPNTTSPLPPNGTDVCPPGTVPLSGRVATPTGSDYPNEPYWGKDGKLYWRPKN